MAEPAAVSPQPAVGVWDPAVRVLHWTLVAAVTIAWALSERDAALHEAAGWVALGAAALRLAWGAVGSRNARFSRFLRGPRATWAYLGDVLARREPRHLGHNPLGAWMIVALLGTVAGLGLTGWLFTTERFWGDARLGTLHEAARKPGFANDLQARLNDGWAAGSPFAWCERVEVLTRAPVNRAALLQGRDFVGDLLRMIDGAPEDPVLLAKLAQQQLPLYGHARAGRILGSRAPGPEDMPALLADAESACLEALS